MSEQEQMSQLSALFDNELPPAEADLVIRRLLKDPGLRSRWERYALIGACLREDPVATGRPLSVAARVQKQLSAEVEVPQAAGQAVVSYPGQRQGWSQFGRGALGGAIAAGVAAVALVLMRPMGPEAAAPALQMAAAQNSDATLLAAVPTPVAVAVAAGVAASLPVAAEDTPPPSYTSPMESTSRRITGSLASYIVAHSEVAASAGRLLPLSAAMNGYDITQDTVVMTEAEIGAFR